ncbi:MAG: glycosyltransferase family 2 protein [Bacteroidota bacterium]|nr:glycosyltransferase family 2 protein [Bacteroidota bacterium]MDP4226155.1 glycosyltransferase family 2 protein [Bacteroidota bacterium]MDP4274793.1 glycosyltransferase family 2 protein [Bacteroidota bacterium]
MKVCGITFVRNARKYDYPVVESIQSILPVCDKFIVCVGNSEDDTLSLIQSIDSDKIQILPSIWDDSLRKNGEVLAVETNKALDAVPPEFDWVFYIQGDEVVHEKYLETIKENMLKYKDDKQVEGLLFKYVHFYGSYNYIGNSRRWYRNEIRVVRNDRQIRSYKDAQGFRKNDGKLKVKPIEACVFHYGWVRPPQVMQNKTRSFHNLWHSDEWIQKNIANTESYDYSHIDSLCLFKETHPKVMEERIKKAEWKFEFDVKQKKFNLKEWALYLFEKATGIRLFEYKNYEILK